MKVTISGFTIQGGWPSDVCDDSLYGVTVLGGANLIMSNSTVEDVGGDPQTDGCQGGVGIQVGFATSGTTADTGHGHADQRRGDEPTRRTASRWTEPAATPPSTTPP